MHLLALPEDEQQIIRHLCEEEGPQLLLSDLLEEGSPRVAADPLRALVPDLPSRKRRLAAVKSGATASDPAHHRCGSTSCGHDPSVPSEHSQMRQHPETLWTGLPSSSTVRQPSSGAT
jgi:hypothetical protein